MMTYIGVSNYIVVLLLWLSLLVIHSATRHCPNCYNDICLSTGECKWGCKDGWVDKYCSQTCQEECKTSKCKLDSTGTIVCDDGCDDGRCGRKCKRHCNKDCIKCSEKCDCNGTLFPHTDIHGTDYNVTCPTSCQKCGEDGVCITCSSKYFGDKCQFPCRDCVHAESLELFTTYTDCKTCRSEEIYGIPTYLVVNTSLGVIGVVTAIIAIILIGLLLYRCVQKKRKCQDPNNREQQVPLNSSRQHVMETSV